MDNKYQSGKIYRITDFGHNEFYYGSTVTELSMRFGRHLNLVKLYVNGEHNFVSVYTLFQEFGETQCKIELAENYPCNNKEELRKREGWFIQNNECVNRYVAGRASKEYYQGNREDIDAKKKEYKREHKAEYASYQRKYEAKNAGHIKARKAEKIMCPVCKLFISRSNKSIHEKTSKHTRNIDVQTPSEIS